MAASPKLYDSKDLERFVHDLLASAGVKADDARAMAEVFVWANLRGVDSHGVARVPRYLELFDKGEANLNPTISEKVLRPAIAVIEADHAPGAIALTRGADLAVKLARESGIGWVSVKQTVHGGALGYYVERIAKSGMVGIAFLSGMPNMGYPGAKGAALATSPIAIAVPAKASAPFLLDMATATIAFGKIAQHKARGLPLPEGSAVTADGVPTTDPEQAKMPTPLGGMKGAGLALSFELLTSVLLGVPVVAPILAKAEGSKRHRQSAVFLAVDPAVFGDADQFQESVATTLTAIRGMPAVDANEAVGVPGDRGGATARTRTAKGIPLPDRIAGELLELAAARGLTPPATKG